MRRVEQWPLSRMSSINSRCIHSFQIPIKETRQTMYPKYLALGKIQWTAFPVYVF